MKRIQVIDSHTGGEPTRLIVDGGPDLGTGTMSERLKILRDNFDEYRRACVLEPRSSDVVVGGLLCEPTDPQSTIGILFFNSAGYLGMCGHGTIGLLATLYHMGRIKTGVHRIETPVGLVTAEVHDANRVRIENVASFRKKAGVSIDVDGIGEVVGDIAWGGNWFFLANSLQEELSLDRAHHLFDLTWRIRRALAAQGYPEVDHIELFAPPQTPDAHSKNYVHCPGGAYDRSPCGTGTSAKIACLAADGKLQPGEPWIQESFIGSRFDCSYRWEKAEGQAVIPSIMGTAFVNAEASLLIDPRDPFAWGI